MKHTIRSETRLNSKGRSGRRRASSITTKVSEKGRSWQLKVEKEGVERKIIDIMNNNLK